MQVYVKRIDKRLPLPRYYTKGSVGLDFSSRTTVMIPAGRIKRIPLNVIVKIPGGYFLHLALRSSMPEKKGLIIPNGVGIVDQDYAGEQDELLILVYNITKKKVVIKRGERIAQGVFVKMTRPRLRETSRVRSVSRGGVGSTGL